LNLSCIISPAENHGHDAAALEGELSAVDFSYTVGLMLSNLLTTVTRTQCAGIDARAVGALARAVADNPRYGSASYQQLHQQLLARIEKHYGNTEETLAHLNRAISYQKNPDLNMMVVTTLLSDERYGDARAFIEQARHQAPLHPLKRYLWQFTLDELSDYVEEVEASSTGGAGGTSAPDEGPR
jgi:lipopolysaccharide biosynthesis regulator YciM